MVRSLVTPSGDRRGRTMARKYSTCRGILAMARLLAGCFGREGRHPLPGFSFGRENRGHCHITRCEGFGNTSPSEPVSQMVYHLD